jgi:hypothetical protein
MEFHLFDSFTVLDGMTLENFQWHDQCILEQIGEDLGMQYVDCPVVTRSCHQWVGFTEVNLSDSLGVVFQCLVRRIR